jgi:hypothetical protein
VILQDTHLEDDCTQGALIFKDSVLKEQ